MNEVTLFALNDAPTMNSATTAARAFLVAFLLLGFWMIAVGKLNRGVLLVALFVSAGIFTATSANASDQVWTVYPNGTQQFATAGAACQTLSSATFFTVGNGEQNNTVWSCFFRDANGSQFKLGKVARVCINGSVWDSGANACVGGTRCTAGQSFTVNLGVGYARTLNNTDDWIDPRFPETADNGDGCQVTVGDVVPGSCYVVETVGPPYAGYCTFTATTTGAESLPADQEANQTLPPIPCPSGTAPGSVNGVGGCFQTSETTTQKETTTNPDGSTTTTETSTGPTGSTTTITTCTGDGSCTSTTTHVGGGASSKPPSETGGKYDDGTPDGAGGEEGEGDDPCGLPGLPDCRVKVNEEGTPTETPGMAEAFGQAAQAVDDQFNYLTGMGWVRSELPFTWNPPLPDGSCSALEIRGYSLDICDPIGKARQFWSYCLAVMAGLYIWRSATNANPGA